MTRRLLKIGLVAGSLGAAATALAVWFVTGHPDGPVIMAQYFPLIAFMFLAFFSLAVMSKTLVRAVTGMHRFIYRTTGRSGIPLAENRENWNWKDALLLRRIKRNGERG